MTPEDEPSGWKVSNMLLRKSGGQVLVAPVRLKQLGQSWNDAQLWMCLVVKKKKKAERQWRTKEPAVLQSVGLQ